MAHTRLRKFNTADTYPEQKLDNDLCQAVVTRGGKTVWLRGQCPQNLDDAVNLDSHDPVEQTHKVMQNIRQLIEEAGGEAGPVRSAGLKIVDTVSWPVVDLRCDWSEDCPIEQLGLAWKIYKPQMADYTQRAIDPRAAPSYGVPGDE